MNIFLAEFIGTALLVLLGNGVVANSLLKDTKGQNSGWMVITTGWGLAVFVGVSFAGPYSGAHINPVVSLALAINKQLNWTLLPTYITTQITGAMFGSLLVWLFYKDHFDKTDNPELKQACFSTSPAIKNNISNLFSEFIGSFVLIFVLLNFCGAEITEPKIAIGLGSLGALPAAILVWVLGLSLGGTTGYALNPARDFGPRIIYSLLPIKSKVKKHWEYSWIPILGPILGAAAAALLNICLH